MPWGTLGPRAGKETEESGGIAGGFLCHSDSIKCTWEMYSLGNAQFHVNYSDVDGVERL